MASCFILNAVSLLTIKLDVSVNKSNYLSTFGVHGGEIITTEPCLSVKGEHNFLAKVILLIVFHA